MDNSLKRADDPSELARLASALPDIPRWVEARSMLLRGGCRIYGLSQAQELSFVISSAELELISLVGCPSTEAILNAVADNASAASLLATPEIRDYVEQVLPDWIVSPARIYTLKDPARIPALKEGEARLVDSIELESLASMPEELKEELIRASLRSAVAAAIAGDAPVSFCYAASETETLWDVSIDTLAEYRGRGYAARAVAYMNELMRERGRQPVWGAEESNPSSMRLAAKLGFAPVDQIMVFKPPAEDKR